MSEDLKLDDVADVVKSHVEGKADKAELEAVKAEIPSVEGLVKSEEIAGFVKAEELEAAKAATAELTEKLEALDAVVKSAPAVISKGEPEMQEYMKWTATGAGEITAKTSLDFTPHFNKAVTSNANTLNAPEGAAEVFYAMQQMNPLRGLARMMPTSASSVNLPSVTGITAAAEGNVPNSINLATGHAGALGVDNNIVPQKWTSRTAFSDASVGDLPGLDSMVGAFMAQEIAVAEAEDHITPLNAGGFAEVNTGVAAGLPTGIDQWADLVASLSSAYKMNAQFMMSRAALAHLRSTDQAADGSDLIIDPSTGNFRLWGYDIVTNDHMDDGSTAGDNAVYFGDFSRGSIIISRKEMEIERNDYTIPGAVYFYGAMRSRGTAWDTNALVRFNTAV